MQRPDMEVLNKIGSGSIQDFLTQNGILALAHFMELYFNVNGYG